MHAVCCSLHQLLARALVCIPGAIALVRYYALSKLCQWQTGTAAAPKWLLQE
jgi:hypothetical protein